MLNTRKAIALFNLIEKHVPTDTKDIAALDFAGKIIESIISKNEHRVYSDAIILMHGLESLEMLKDENPEELLRMFIDGLIENHIISLVDFFRKVKNGIL